MSDAPGRRNLLTDNRHARTRGVVLKRIRAIEHLVDKLIPYFEDEIANAMDEAPHRARREKLAAIQAHVVKIRLALRHARPYRDGD